MAHSVVVSEITGERHIAVLSREIVPDFLKSLDALTIEMERSSSTAVILVPWREPPETGTRPDGVVDSFLCDADTFRAVRERARSNEPAELCFTLLDGILNQRIAVGRVVVRQLPYQHVRPAARHDEPATLIMAHRGNPRHLSAALESVYRADDAVEMRVCVGLDVNDLSEYGEVREHFPDARFFHVHPTPAGLFVIRQRFLECAAEELFCLQDSDDFSCSDRFAAQFDELKRTGCDMLGCHELRVDEITRTVEAFRLPIDVQRALHAGYSDSQLNGTVVGYRSAALRAGGYSTDQRIANDTQFMLRSYFMLRMRNVDGFYYLRRRHKAALTVAPETGFGTPLRSRLRDTWAADFDAVRAGTLDLVDSSLRPMSAHVDYAVCEWIRDDQPVRYRSPARQACAPAR